MQRMQFTNYKLRHSAHFLEYADEISTENDNKLNKYFQDRNDRSKIILYINSPCSDSHLINELSDSDTKNIYHEEWHMRYDLPVYKKDHYAIYFNYELEKSYYEYEEQILNEFFNQFFLDVSERYCHQIIYYNANYFTHIDSHLYATEKLPEYNMSREYKYYYNLRWNEYSEEVKLIMLELYMVQHENIRSFSCKNHRISEEMIHNFCKPHNYQSKRSKSRLILLWKQFATALFNENINMEEYLKVKEPLLQYSCSDIKTDNIIKYIIDQWIQLEYLPFDILYKLENCFRDKIKQSTHSKLNYRIHNQIEKVKCILKEVLFREYYLPPI